MTEIDEATLNSLGDKLEALELNDKERAVLDLVLQRAEEDEAEVVGFAFGGLSSGANLSAMGLRVGLGTGLVPRPSIGSRQPGIDTGVPPP